MRERTRAKEDIIECGLEDFERLKSNKESKFFYKKINESRKDFQPRTILCRNKERKLLSEEGDILRRWAEDFDELLNKEFFNQNVNSQETFQVHSDTDEPIPTLDEVDNAIKKLKDSKTPGKDLI